MCFVTLGIDVFNEWIIKSFFPSNMVRFKLTLQSRISDSLIRQDSKFHLFSSLRRNEVTDSHVLNIAVLNYKKYNYRPQQ